MNRLMIIPAAGSGSRLQSSTPKVLLPVSGKPMIDHLFTLYRDVIDRFILVLHPSFEKEVREYCSRFPFAIAYELQESPTGMLDAILVPQQRVQEYQPEQIWITWCDQIGVHPRTVRELARLSKENAGLIFPTVSRANPYIHMVRNQEGRIVKVLQRREGDRLPEIGENDLGLFCLSRQTYLELLPAYSVEASQPAATGERNFLPFIVWLSARSDVRTFPAQDEIESVGINTQEELQLMQRHLAERPRTLSIVIPAFNEERFIGQLLEKVIAVDLSQFFIDKEVIVIDDHSTDRTAEIVRGFPASLHTLPKNSGKGEAVKTGIAMATGDYLMIQDADLEYDPNDYVPMLEMLLSGFADVVYGSRYMRAGKYPSQSWAAYLGGRSLSIASWFFTGTYLTDTVTALKLFRTETVKSLDLQTTGFELDHEITSKILSRGLRIREVPIRYFPRTKEEGKKIGLKDWLTAVKTFHGFGKWQKRR